MVADPIYRPIALIKDAFRKGTSTGSTDVLQLVAKLARDCNWLSQVPLLEAATADTIKPGTLVRFRGMVQDLLNSEFYVGSYQDAATREWHTTKYCDAVPPELEDATETRLAERHPVYCVPVPGQSGWVTASMRDMHGPAMEAAAAARAGAGAPGSAGRSAKRSRAAEGEDELSQDDRMDSDQATAAAVAATAAADAVPTDNADSRGKQAKLNADQPAATASPGARPDGSRSGGQAPSLTEGHCMVYIYEQPERLRLNDVIDVLGVLSVMPELAALHLNDHDHDHEGEQEDELFAAARAEQRAAHPPTSQVFRLHAILVTPEPRALPRHLVPLRPADLAPRLPELRRRAKALLSLALGGDDFAAEYLLLLLVSGVYQRCYSRPVGSLSLNLTKCPDAAGASTSDVGRFAAGLACAVSALATACRALPVSLQSMNAEEWVPRRDAATVRLGRGQLQLAPGTVLLLDETRLSSGTLTATGLKNVQHLQRVLVEQSLSLDFEFHQQQFPLDLPVLTLSQGRSVLREHHAVVLPLLRPGTGGAIGATTTASSAPIGVDEAALQAAAAAVDLTAVRQYLAAAREARVELSESVTQRLAEDFPRLRALNPAFTADDFSTHVLLAKLTAASHGQDSLTPEVWKEVCGMERERMRRQA